MRDAPFVLDTGIPTVKSLPEDGDLMIEGYAADFEVDRQNEKFLPGAFDAACEKATKDEIPLLMEHDNNRQLGVIEQLEVKPEGLWVRARIAKAVAGSWAEDAVNKIRRGMMKGLSVRGLSHGYHTPEGPRIAGIDLAEISVTPVPVQPGALFAVAQKSLAYAEGDDLAAFSDEEVAAALDQYYSQRLERIRKSFAQVEQALSTIST